MRAYARKTPIRSEFAGTVPIESALASLYLVYQPIVSWPSGRVIGYEALARCLEPGFENPAILFRAAARLGLAGDLGRRVRILAFGALTSGPEDTTLFLNLHPTELMEPELSAPDALLAPHADRIVFELTEERPPARLNGAVARLQARGYRVALDDLGSGHNGLCALASLSPDCVKLDIALIRGCHADPRRQRVIRSILVLCRDLGMRAICEGVETFLELRTLVRLGARYFQGFYFGRPDAWLRGPRPRSRPRSRRKGA